MYFLWSREPLPPPPSAVSPAGPWFAWFATAVLLWRCRKRISRAISYTCLPLRLLKHQPKQHHLRGGPPRLCVSRAAAFQRQRPAAARGDHYQMAVKRLSPKLIAAAIDEKQQQQQQQKRRCQQRQVTFKEPMSIGNESLTQLDNSSSSNTCQSSFDLMDSSPPSSNTRYKNAAIAAATNPITNHPPASTMKSGRSKRKASMSSLKKQQQQQHNVTRASRKLTLNNSGGYGVHICQQAVFYRVTRSGRVYG